MRGKYGRDQIDKDIVIIKEVGGRIRVETAKAEAQGARAETDIELASAKVAPESVKPQS